MSHGAQELRLAQQDTRVARVPTQAAERRADEEAVDLVERQSPRAFLDLALPRAVQRFRCIAAHVAPHGALVVLDGRIRASWAAPFGDALPSFHTTSWDVFRTWANPLHAVGGAR